MRPTLKLHRPDPAFILKPKFHVCTLCPSNDWAGFGRRKGFMIYLNSDGNWYDGKGRNREWSDFNHALQYVQRHYDRLAVFGAVPVVRSVSFLAVQRPPVILTPV